MGESQIDRMIEVVSAFQKLDYPGTESILIPLKKSEWGELLKALLELKNLRLHVREAYRSIYQE